MLILAIQCQAGQLAPEPAGAFILIRSAGDDWQALGTPTANAAVSEKACQWLSCDAFADVAASKVRLAPIRGNRVPGLMLRQFPLAVMHVVRTVPGYPCFWRMPPLALNRLPQ